MEASLFSNLAWLPKPPKDFRQRVLALLDQTGDLGASVRFLASYALDANHLNSLANAIGRGRHAGRSFAPLTPFRLGLLGNGTLDLMIPALVSSAARHGFLLECVVADYDQIIQEATSPESKINRAGVDAVLIALDYRGLPLQFKPGDREVSHASVTRALEYIDAVRSGVRQHGNAPCIVQTLAPPIETVFGSLERAIPGTPRHMVERINSQLMESVAASNDLLLDVAGLAETVGLAAWFDPALWNLGEYSTA
jgi:predicted enzyme involved in methoxymalonyl-ACP biosynthesis